MTEVEAFELALMASQNATESFALYVTITTAFLAAVYFIGKDLSQYAALVVTGLYFTSATMSAINTFTDTQWWVSVVAHAPA
jgi:hypothetical protein